VKKERWEEMFGERFTKWFCKWLFMMHTQKGGYPEMMLTLVARDNWRLRGLLRMYYMDIGEDRETASEIVSSIGKVGLGCIKYKMWRSLRSFLIEDGKSKESAEETMNVCIKVYK